MLIWNDTKVTLQTARQTDKSEVIRSNIGRLRNNQYSRRGPGARPPPHALPLRPRRNGVGAHSLTTDTADSRANRSPWRLLQSSGHWLHLRAGFGCGQTSRYSLTATPIHRDRHCILWPQRQSPRVVPTRSWLRRRGVPEAATKRDKITTTMASE